MGVAGHAEAHPTKCSSLPYYISLMDISTQKIKEIDSLLPEISMIKKKLQPDWTRAFKQITCKPGFSQIWGLLRKVSYLENLEDIFFRRINLSLFFVF